MRTPLAARLFASSVIVAGCGAPPQVAPSPPPRTSVAPPVVAVASPPKPTLRLPDVAAPRKYALDLYVTPTSDAFRGRVVIDVDVRTATRLVWLHAADLDVDRVGVREAGGAEREGAVGERGDELIALAFDPPLAKGAAQITLDYRGKVDAQRSRGIYRYTERGASYAFTFFEPTDARRAFPCFDEPSAKVPWTLTLHVPKTDVALANTKETSERDEPGDTKAVTFAETKPLPSYLVAFAVGPFDLVPGKDGPNGEPLRIAVPKGRGAEAAYAAEHTGEYVRILEQYLRIPYPFEKLDVAVVPRYWGTMEHPGLVALGQPLSLIEPREMSVERAERYSNIAIHELAHYWFGDYVTTAWWDDTWLNEAMGTWMDAKATDAFDPSFQVPLQRKRNVASAMAADALPSAKAIHQPVRTVADIEASFDASLTYYKGSAVLTMFEHFVGPERFRDVMTAYLRTHAYANATSADFLGALREGAGAEVASAMAAIVDRPGIPLVSVDLRCDAGAPSLHVTQERFAALGAHFAPEAPFPIPMCVAYDAGAGVKRTCRIVDRAETDVALDSPVCPAWVDANEGAFGYYRVAYSPALAAHLAARDKAASVMERAARFGDVRALALAGRAPMRDLVAQTSALASADAYLAGDAIETVIRLRDLVGPEDPALRAFVKRRFAPRLQATTMRAAKSDDRFTRALRGQLIDLLATLADDRAVQGEARRRVGVYLDTHAGIGPENVPSVLGAAAYAGDRALFDRLLAAARKASGPHERELLLGALGAFHDPALRSAALALVTSNDLDPRDTAVILNAAAKVDPEGTVDFLVAHFDAIAARSRDDETSERLELVGSLCDAGRVERARAALAERAARIDGGTFHLAKAMDRAMTCAAARASFAREAEAALAESKASK